MASVNVYDLNYTDAFVLGIKNYANFKGRASRSEYWRFMAGMMMVQGTLGAVSYTHLDVYKRQPFDVLLLSATMPIYRIRTYLHKPLCQYLD